MCNSLELAAVVIPIYKDQPTEFERVSFRRCVEVLGKYPVLLVGPENLNIEEYKKISSDVVFIPFPRACFASIPSYNKLLVSSRFYERFLEYEYILIYQLDAFVFEDRLEYWCKQGYDYIGAPWITGKWILELKDRFRLPFDKWINRVGNGGFSLRKVESFYTSAKRLRWLTFLIPNKYHEDFFWSTIVHSLLPSFKIPAVKDALMFAFEEDPAKAYEITNQQLPFGCHAWEKYDLNFWKAEFAKFGYGV